MLGQDLAQGDLVEVTLRTAGGAQHGRHGPETAAGLKLLLGQDGQLALAVLLGLLRVLEPGLGHLVGRVGLLLVDLRLVVTLGQHLGLGLE